MGPLFFAVAALAVVAFLQFSLFIVSKRRLDHLLASHNRSFEEWRTKEENLTAEFSQIRGEIADLRCSPAIAPTLGQSMNLSRRNQVLRMHFRGDSPSRIASVLQISKGEVDLLLKVHRMVIPSRTWTGSSGPERAKAPGIVSAFERPTEEIESPPIEPDGSINSDASPENQGAARLADADLRS
jgi:hypothetical protein